MNVGIFWVRVMKCTCAQTRSWFMLSSERVFGGMEFEPMLTPREKSPLPQISPEEDWTCGAVDSKPKHYQWAIPAHPDVQGQGHTGAKEGLLTCPPFHKDLLPRWNLMYSWDMLYWWSWYLFNDIWLMLQGGNFIRTILFTRKEEKEIGKERKRKQLDHWFAFGCLITNFFQMSCDNSLLWTP